MPRTEARIFTSIWRDEHFLALTPGAQRLDTAFPLNAKLLGLLRTKRGQRAAA